MDPIFLVDLDDTLFRSRRKLGEFADEQLTLGARVLDPEAPSEKHSYMTPTQKAMVDWLLRSAEVIPVTARGSESYAKVEIPFNSYAILSNGAVILGQDGTPDAEWRDIVTQKLLPYADQFEELLDGGRARSGELGVSIRCWSVLEEGVATYVVFKENGGDGSRLQEIVPIVEQQGWVRHHNGNNLALIPPVISKRLAADFLLERLRRDTPERPVFGLGDSTSDMSYMSICDWWGAPRDSQLTDLVAGVLAKR